MCKQVSKGPEEISAGQGGAWEGRRHLVAPAMAGGVDKPGDVVYPYSAEGSTPYERGEAAKCEERCKHAHHVPGVCALDEAVEGLCVQVGCVTP